MIFQGKDINNLTYQDIASFISEEVPESKTLDYKRDISNESLAKTISAMANTFGGFILIGVEDNDSRPDPESEGLEWREGFREQINNICLSRINPYIHNLKIVICTEEIGDEEDEENENKAFILIQIPASDVAPHTVDGGKKIYIRTQASNEPVEFGDEVAPIEQIEWLQERREESEELRKSFFTNAEKRYEKVRQKMSSGDAELSPVPANFTITTIPLYPATNGFLSYTELPDTAEDIRVEYNDVNMLPEYVHNYHSVQDGIYMAPNFGSQTLNPEYVELNQFGFYFFRQGLSIEQESQLNCYLSSVTTIINTFLKSASKLYNNNGYWGSLLFKLKAENLEGITFIDSTARPNFSQEEQPLDDQIEIEFILFSNRLSDKGCFLKIVRKLAWSLGFNNIAKDDSLLENYLED